MSGAEIVAAARDWIGTPYHHQASAKDVGTDCLGLVLGVWREMKGQVPVVIPPYTMDWAEPQREEVLWQSARTHLRELTTPSEGAVILFRMKDSMVAKHLGILTANGSEPRFVHAYMRHGVIESPLSVPWQRRIVSYFAFPE